MGLFVNESGWDRVVRVVLGVLLVGAALAGAVTGALGIVAGVAGLVLLATGVVGWCPLYRLFRVSTHKHAA
jgi:Inner membrane protein YgaP-like, transmembrane domain